MNYQLNDIATYLRSMVIILIRKLATQKKNAKKSLKKQLKALEEQHEKNKKIQDSNKTLEDSIFEFSNKIENTRQEIKEELEKKCQLERNLEEKDNEIKNKNSYVDYLKAEKCALMVKHSNAQSSKKLSTKKRAHTALKKEGFVKSLIKPYRLLGFQFNVPAGSDRSVNLNASFVEKRTPRTQFTDGSPRVYDL